ncbi:MAG: XdhC/CoxI family protein [Dehalococcoidia bacterium]|nr:XdhC/CoxI family protein [Dehalococcoidia bacterium]
MEQVFQEAERLLGAGQPFVLATVVRTKGSTPQKPGAKLLVRGDGAIVGTLGGGCIEADVWAEAKEILAEGGGTQLRHFLLNEDIAARDGLVCGGNMDILIDPVAGQAGLAGLVAQVQEIVAAYAGKGDCALATLVSPGAGAGTPGGKLFIRASGRASGETQGTLGSAALDAQAIALARSLMPKGREQWVDADGGAKYYVETFTNPATVVIAGGGHVGKAVYAVARLLGFKVIVVDDRPMYANAERFPEASQIVVDDFARGLRSLQMTPNCYVIVATRGHKLDDLALMEAARSDAGYVGLLGSRRKAVMIFRDLFRAGIPASRIAEIRAPVGLDLGGRTPSEIAVSIMAEIVAVKHGRSGGAMTMDTRMLEKAKLLAAKPLQHAEEEAEALAG